MDNYYLTENIEVHVEDNHYIIKNKQTRRYYQLDIEQFSVLNALLNQDIKHTTTYDQSDINNIEQIILEKEIKKTQDVLVDFSKYKLHHFLKFIVNKIGMLIFHRFVLFFVFILSIFTYMAYPMNISNMTYLDVLGSIIWFFLLIIFHEIGHILALMYYKREVYDYGIKKVSGRMSFYVNTADIYMCNKWQRIVVSYAGVHFTLIMSLLCNSFSMWIDNSNLIYTYIAFLYSFFNLLPIYHLDGAFILSDLFNVKDIEKKGKQAFLNRKKQSIVKWNNFIYLSIYIFNQIIPFFLSIYFVFKWMEGR